MADISITFGLLGIGFVMLAIGGIAFKPKNTDKNFDLSDAFYMLFIIIALLFAALSAFSLSLPNAAGNVVTSLNNQSGALTLIGQNGISVNTNGNVIGISGSSLTPSLASLSLTTNTIYQNTNATAPLYIYSITHSAPLSAYLGSSPSNMLEVAYEDGGGVTVSAIVYQLAGYNMSSMVVVPPEWYYKFNFTSASFYGEKT